ncbi:hypothetical protein G7046_g5640 [Stylonectria norvegica]|nr:hypothetical protein G7046_g5640 [Stylonectria norvegica]
MAGTGWNQSRAQSPSSTSRSRPLGHFRSLSSMSAGPNHRPRTPSLTPTHTPTKSPSTSHLATTSSITPFNVSDEMTTLPDPRSRAMSPADDSGVATPTHHPDLNDEVAALSTKLINAINHQTFLDDSLSASRHELETARDRIRNLEAQNASHREMLTGDVWVRKHTVEADKKLLLARIAEEKAKRYDVEREKKKIEQELENLTTALFEEANHMVIAAKEEAKADHDALQRKNDQLKAQLVDSEGLLKTQQEQLSQLKQVMEHMAAEQEDQANTTAPSSPGFAKSDSRDDDRPSTDAPATPLWSSTPEPSHPTSFTHLIQPVLRTDLTSYDDFTILARLSRKRANSRVSSGSMGFSNSLSLSLGGSTSSAHPSNASTTSLATSAANTSSAPQSPNTPASAFSVNSSASTVPIPNLKDTRFYKRVLAEDIDPTLRLDTAPGLSWLARRTVLGSMVEGTLVVEPVPATSTGFMALTKPQFYPCSLCGESRKDAAYLRNHRFRTSEADSAQRYPLCKYCLTRVRSTCDFLGFLRMVRDGHWRADDENHEKVAWEESVRLRDQMFWSRIGGGVIPLIHNGLSMDMDKSARNSHEDNEIPEDAVVVKDVSNVREASPVDLSRIPRERKAKGSIEEPHTPPEQTEGGVDITFRNSTQSLDVKSISSDDTKRLSITIPSTEQPV